jgi:putative SOS response-associated peptidase YedK
MISRTDAEDSYNVAPGTYRPVLHIENGQLFVDDLHWGYRSAWAEASGKIPMAINTRAEKISNSYWRGMLKNGRAIVPAFGWYEWTGEKGEKQPWHIHKHDRSPIYLAALANHGVKTDAKALHGFTIVTADAEGGMIDVHDRRPVALSADAAASWLDPATPSEMAEEIVRVAALGPDAFAWYAVDRAIGNVRNQGHKLAEAIKI